MLEKIFGQKWLYMLLSVMLATVFWFYVRQIEDPVQSKEIHGVPVVLTGENMLENLGLTVSDVSVETVDLIIRANISVLDQLSRRNVSVALDVQKCAGTGDFELSYTVSLPTTLNYTSIAVEKRTPALVTVTVEKLYSQMFPVEFSFVGSVAEGYQAGQGYVNPEFVSISGSVEQVSRVDRVVAVLERTDLRATFSGELALVMLDENGKALTDLEVKLSDTSVYATLPVVVVRKIPLTVNFTMGGGVSTQDDYSYEISPSTITVSGAEEDMLALREISLGNIELAKVVGTSSFTFPISLDSALENSSGINAATVTVTVTGLDTKPFDVTNIELVNIPPGYRAVATTEMRTVVVRGKSEDLELIDASQLRIVADMSNITVAGSASVPARVYLDAAGQVGVVGDYSIVVNVSR